MEKKGTILIVEDRIDEKIGHFKEILESRDYDVQFAGTLENANILLGANINKLDGIILDFSFPVSDEDLSDNINDLPCGVELLSRYKRIVQSQGIPIVINSTAEKSLKIEKLKKIGIELDEKNNGITKPRFMQSMPIYNIDNESNPLVSATSQMVEEILKMFEERTIQRKTTEKIDADNKWKRGTTGHYNESTGKFTYYRDGD